MQIAKNFVRFECSLSSVSPPYVNCSKYRIKLNYEKRETKFLFPKYLIKNQSIFQCVKNSKLCNSIILVALLLKNLLIAILLEYYTSILQECFVFVGCVDASVPIPTEHPCHNYYPK